MENGGETASFRKGRMFVGYNRRNVGKIGRVRRKTQIWESGRNDVEGKADSFWKGSRIMEYEGRDPWKRKARGKGNASQGEWEEESAFEEW